MDVEFYPVLPGMYTPQKADKSAQGTLPVRAVQYCEPVRLASGLGWYGYAPVDLALQWDGSSDVLAVWVDDEPTPGLQMGQALQAPGFPAQWNAVAPRTLRDESYPMLSRSPLEVGMLQIWTGCFVRTPPDWVVLVRPVANVAAAFGYTVFEGVLETNTDRDPPWFGPLFTNIMLTKTDVRIEIPHDKPLCQLQPVAMHALTATAKIIPFAAWTEREWSQYFGTVVAPNIAPQSPGVYATHSRQQPR